MELQSEVEGAPVEIEAIGVSEVRIVGPLARAPLPHRLIDMRRARNRLDHAARAGDAIATTVARFTHSAR